ncbi:hypothetical protein F5Y18DRAFT_437119 [Xylariaceae sp. FL1019]|nr:hypothetical protein F5Y18DRAFT_437119 [Xylariaceae sp. FL1019]
MCFSEFLGYTCGHTSVAVLRECPMTTHQHNNPACPTPALRPMHAPHMCNACSRIMHERAVDTMEFTHQWIHERGACSCETVFPALLGPKLIKPPASSSDGSEHQSTQAVSTLHEGNGATIPLFQETSDGHHTKVAIRLKSQYAVEWRDDHAKLHEEGKCQCPVTFEKFQLTEADKGLLVEAAKQKKGQEKKNKKPQYIGQEFVPGADHHASSASSSQQGRASSEYGHISSDQGQPPTNRTTTRNGPRGRRSKRRGYKYGGGQIQRAALSGYETENLKNMTTNTPFAEKYLTIKNPVPALKSMNYEPMGVSMDIQRNDLFAQNYQPDGLPIAGLMINTGEPTAQEIANPGLYPTPHGYPMAGFPIGAGPEGQSHAGAFDDCSLSYTHWSVSNQRRSSVHFPFDESDVSGSSYR